MSEVKEHSVIYLSPSDDPLREWCQDDVWEESVRYNLGTDFDRVTAERDALLTAADERVDVLEAEKKRLGLMVSQSDYNYDADRMQFKARIDVLEGLLISWLKDFGRTHSGLQRLKERTQAALKPAETAKDEHVCTGCGSKGWTANCKECVPY